MSEKKLRNPVGYTDLIGASGISKSDLRIQINGAIDEASAVLSLAKSFLPEAYWQDKLTICQQDLSKMMGFTARIGTEKELPASPELFNEEFERLEALLDEIKSQVEMPRKFIFPGYTQTTGTLDLARSIVRRAERVVNEGYDTLGIDAANIRQYLNRLNSLCYLLILIYPDPEADS